MPWYHVVAHFFGGALLANFVPHFVSGVSGRSFPSPFAKPPFRGLSSPAVNVLWGLFNLAVAYALLVVVGSFELRRAADVVISAAGFGLASVGLARKLSRLRHGSDQSNTACRTLAHPRVGARGPSRRGVRAGASR